MFLRLLSVRSFRWGFGVSFASPYGYFCAFVTCFVFLCVFSSGLCSLLSRSSCSLTWSFLAAGLFLLCGTVFPVVFHVPLLVLVSSAFSGLFLFSFPLFPGICPVSSSILLGLVPVCSGSVSFLRHRLPVLSCLSFSPLLVDSPPRAFFDLLAFAYFVGFAFPVFPSLAPPCLSPLVFAFCMLRFWIILVVPLSVLSNAVTTVACFLSSSMFFRLLQFWLSLPVSSPFSVCCVSFCSLVVFPVFRILRLRLLFPFAAPRLSSMLRVLLWLYPSCPEAAFHAFCWFSFT